MSTENADNSLAGALAGLEAEVSKAEKGIEQNATEIIDAAPNVTIKPDDKNTEIIDAAPFEEDHGEKSKLGRKFKRLEQTQESLDKKLDAILTRLTPKEIEPEEEDFPLSEYPTAEELKEFKKFTLKQSKEAAIKVAMEAQLRVNSDKENYEKSYVSLLYEMTDQADEDEEITTQIKDLMTSTDSRFNKIHTGDPVKDFLKNYKNTTDFLLRKNMAKKPNVNGKPSGVPTSVNVPNTTQRVVSFYRDKFDTIETSLASVFTDDELFNMAL